jgi:hypothetical protein
VEDQFVEDLYESLPGFYRVALVAKVGIVCSNSRDFLVSFTFTGHFAILKPHKAYMCHEGGQLVQDI